MVSCTFRRKVQEPRAKVEVSMASATTVGSQFIRPSFVGKAKGKGQGKKGDSKGWNDSNGWTLGKGWSDSKGWNSSGKGWEQQRPASMNILDRNSKQYDVLVTEMSTQEKTVRDGDWCVPVKHVAKLNRMRRQTNIKFFVDPEEENRDNDTTPDWLGSKQSDLEDDVSYKCSCCEAGGTHWERTRNLPTTKKPSVCFSSLTDADINFFEKGNTDLCELQQNAWAPLPKPLVVDSEAGETVMTEADGSRANHFYTTADGSKVYNEGQSKVDVCTLDGQQRRPMTFRFARVNKALGSVSQMVKNGNKLVFDQDSSGKDMSYIQNKRSNEKIWAADLMTRYAHVGDYGKTAVQLIRGSKSSRNIAQVGEKILLKPLKLSGHHRGNMEDTFLDGIILGMRLRSDEILVGTTNGVIKTRTLRRRVEEEQWENEIAKSTKWEPRQLVPGINSDHVPAAISDRAGVPLEEDQPRKHEEF